MSHGACRANGSRCDTENTSDLRDLVLFLPGICITKAVEGHVRTDDRWPTSVFHECRQRDGLKGVGGESISVDDGKVVGQYTGLMGDDFTLSARVGRELARAACMSPHRPRR